MKDGKYHGKYVRIYSDGSREEKEYKNGSQIGVERKYNRERTLSFKVVVPKAI